MNQPTNEADKLLTPAQKALNRLLKGIDTRGYGITEKEFLAKDAELLIDALAVKEPCKHRLMFINDMEAKVKCVQCQVVWKFDSESSRYIPFDPAICECCGQKKATV